ncbi:hypothetical protein HDF12_000091 [Edaphobacter lichenicola]|uniref:Uncharacterized protein n=2 Tax=Tunturiibacter TaxID=3154218 RepID=A0A7Y9NI02_9BACT|nr:hypothetical protein [Edaphobacter lichenicola]NYF49726.1 hypothetical protein [Edaphobacter lichenicola]
MPTEQAVLIESAPAQLSQFWNWAVEAANKLRKG